MLSWGWGCWGSLPALHASCCLALATQPPLLWLCPFQVPPPCPEPSSMNHWQFQSPQRMQQTNVALLGRETVGNKVRSAAPGPSPKSPLPSRPDKSSLYPSGAGALRVQP